MPKKIANTISVIELLEMFSTEHKSVKWLEQARWNGKPACPKCSDAEKIKIRKGHKHSYFCNPCRYKFSVKTNTIMHGSNLPVQRWAITIYCVLTARKGIDLPPNNGHKNV